MLNKIYKIGFVSAIATSPLFAFAQDLPKTKQIFLSVSYLVGILVPTAFFLAVAVFFYGVVKYIWSEGQGKADGRMIMTWGIVALFVMSSVWGLVAFMRGELGVLDNTNMPIPTIGS